MVPESNGVEWTRMSSPATSLTPDVSLTLRCHCSCVTALCVPHQTFDSDATVLARTTDLILMPLFLLGPQLRMRRPTCPAVLYL